MKDAIYISLIAILIAIWVLYPKDIPLDNKGEIMILTKQKQALQKTIDAQDIYIHEQEQKLKTQNVETIKYVYKNKIDSVRSLPVSEQLLFFTSWTTDTVKR